MLDYNYMVLTCRQGQCEVGQVGEQGVRGKGGSTIFKQCCMYLVAMHVETKGETQRLTGGWADDARAFTCCHKAVIPLQGSSACSSGEGAPGESTLPYASVSILEGMWVQVNGHYPTPLDDMEVNFGLVTGSVIGRRQEPGKGV